MEYRVLNFPSLEHLKDYLNRFNIAQERIVYIGKDPARTLGAFQMLLKVDKGY